MVAAPVHVGLLCAMRSAVLAVGVLAAVPQQASAQSVADFYAGKTIGVIVSTGSGGIFDQTARTLARHMPRHLPGSPTMIVRNMPGGGHIRATQHMYTQATRDGTSLGLVNNGIPMEQIVQGPTSPFDVRRFNWIGSAGLGNLLTVAWHTSGVKTIEDVMSRELIAGATGVSSNAFLYPNALNILLGTKFRIVSGYSTSPEADLGMERGEVAARAGFSLSAIMSEHPEWIREKKVVVLFQTGTAREATLPDVPLMHELAKTEEARKVLALMSSSVSLGRPFFTTPDVPTDRVEALRKAFNATLADDAFKDEAEKARLDIRPVPGERVAELVNAIANAPPEVVAQLRQAFGRQAGKAPD